MAEHAHLKIGFTGALDSGVNWQLIGARKNDMMRIEKKSMNRANFPGSYLYFSAASGANPVEFTCVFLEEKTV